jgi:hypothetical protein
LSSIDARLLAVALVAFLQSGDAGAADQGAPAALLARLASSSARFEALLERATFTVTGHMEALDGDGDVSERREGAFRVSRKGRHATVHVIRYVEDGEDKTGEAREKAAKDERKRLAQKRDPDKEVHMPFLAGVQHRYSYRLGETDPRAPSRVRVYFTAKEPARNLGNGSAWVDGATGEIFSIGVSPSETPMFVSYVNLTLEFGERTKLGPAISRLGFETEGGVLFFRKHVRGSAVLSSYEFR